ncbi:penicillin acylase family protein [Cytophagales bacterium LB-30]|uniref:Penicillin acylase family protein n=1 Tax=Shiella aurantiaca TaxID=3058365 RepID=A0ABT8F4G2_9BACT|nr:penicillin acylase family protein [Shiella aurantiaca]MDN4164871.1 penicillin acylase family protein [Shiella aurantiaca]
MRLLKRILLSLLFFVLLASLGIYIYLYSLIPQYEGEATLAGLSEETEVYFDKYGIPHIYAQSETDAFRALGYVHAQERLFQMEMIRRVASGRLSEVLGEEMLNTDKFFLSLGITELAETSDSLYFRNSHAPYAQSAKAYIDGVNNYIRLGKKPIEFSLIGIPLQEFTTKDIYLITAFMSFGFAEGFKIDPLVEHVYQKLGADYLKDWMLGWEEGATKIPVTRRESKATQALAQAASQVVNTLPIPTWIGSNGWVLGPKKTKNGAVILENDTHMGHSAPCVWYEAHIEYPGFGLYGNYVAGFPFPMVGNTRQSGWGLTMFENDDVDFYYEKVNPQDSTQFWANDHWEQAAIRQYTIPVKDKETVSFQVRVTRNGPIINDFMESIAAISQEPISVWWAFTQQPNRDIEAVYEVAHAETSEKAHAAASKIYAPGLNVMYGNAQGEYAWWAAGRLIDRPFSQTTKVFRNGADSLYQPKGWYDFEQNPWSINPANGYTYSANNQPDSIEGHLYPGYYVPHNRAHRITQLLDARNDWDVQSIQAMATDHTSPIDAKSVQVLLALLKPESLSEVEKEAFSVLQNWKGDYSIEQSAPLLFNHWTYQIFRHSHLDELGYELFSTFMGTHEMKKTIAPFFANDSSLWWDNTKTEPKETRQQIVQEAFQETVRLLSERYGAKLSDWQWGKGHQLTHEHAIGKKKPFHLLFNIGPFETPGGNEVINNQGYVWSGAEIEQITFGPAMRRVIDFSDPENSYSILPTGQSGYFMSPHYDDQAEMYVNNQFRKQLMNREEITQGGLRKLVLSPR